VNRPHCAIRYSIAAAGLLLGASQASALDFEADSGISLDVDTTLTYGAQWRVESADDKLLRRPDPSWDFGRKFSFLTDPDTVVAQNMDDGNNSFDTGLISNRATVLADIELGKDDYGIFARARAFCDQVYANRHTAMDETGYRTMNNAPATPLGDFPDETEDEQGAHAEFLDAYAYANFDIGERVLDVRVGRQVINWGEATFFPGINAMQNRFDASVANVPGTEVKEILLPTGAVYAQIDLSSALALQTYYQYEWKHTILNGVGSYFSQQDYLGPGADSFYVGVLELFGMDPRIPRLADDEPGDQGQYGVALRYALESGTELGFYYLNAHNKAPSFERNELSLAGQQLPVSYRIRYFGDISTMGASFTTLLGDVQVNGEISYRENAPMADQGGSPRRDELLQGQLGFTQVFRPTALWDDLTVVGEIVGFEDVGRNGDEVAFDARSFSYALRADFAYKNVLQALDTDVLVFVMHTLDGTVREANVVDDAVVASIALRGTWLDKIIAELSYAQYFGGGFDNWLIDRDNVAFNIKYSF
jgi:Protein of unknown function (DUF1302)